MERGEKEGNSSTLHPLPWIPFKQVTAESALKGEKSTQKEKSLATHQQGKRSTTNVSKEGKEKKIVVHQLWFSRKGGEIARGTERKILPERREKMLEDKGLHRGKKYGCPKSR